ncbi:lipocalin family protein [Rhodanobacter sp. 7MK24]|nr:lipocalin family protein [Rhodanobacter sp. 7MK24]
MRTFRALVLGMALFSSVASAGTLPPIQPVPHVDLPRFMGTWYMIAAIPTVFERNAWNAVETYTLQPNGNVITTLCFNKGAADGPLKQIHSTAYVRPNTGSSVWGVQVFWPIKAQYVVAWLKPDYSEMIVARDARDYTWVFARTPTVTAADWASLRMQVAAMGYDTSELRQIPQLGAVGSGSTSHPQ